MSEEAPVVSDQLADAAFPAEGGDAAPVVEVDLCLLTAEKIKPGLGELGRTADQTYAFLKLSVPGIGIKSLEGDVMNYQELTTIDVSNNEINSLKGANVLNNIVHLNAQFNKLTRIDDFDTTVNLQILEVDNNQLNSMCMQQHLSLFALTMTKNQLTQFDVGTEVSAVELVDVSGNTIDSFKGVESFKNVKVLIAKTNKISSLDGVEKLWALERLDVSENDLSSYNELKKLEHLVYLKSVNVEANPKLFEGKDDAPEAVRLEILLVLPNLDVLNEAPVTLQERQAADALKKERDAEAAAKAKEEEEARKAAEGGDAPAEE